MLEKNHKTGELDKPKIILRMIFVANDQSAKVVKPGEESFDLPTALESAQRTTVLRDSFRPATLAMWSNHFCTELLQLFFIQRVTVISLVADEPLGYISDEPLLQSLRDQFYFSWASIVCAYGERKTIAVCNCHDLGALSTFSLSH